MAEKIINFVALLGEWGYLVIFLAAFLESSAFMGLLVPGESIVVLAGFLASQGHLELGDCMAVIALGAVLGDSAGYTLGRFIGREYFSRHDRLLLIKASYIKRTEEYFSRHGGKTIFFGRFIGLFRAMAPFVAGMSRMRYTRFLAFNAAGGVAWAVSFTLLGYFFGQSWRAIERWAGRAGVFALFIIAVLAGLAYLYRKTVRRQEELYAWARRRYDAVASAPWVIGFGAAHPALVSFVMERLSPRGYLGLHLTVGFAASAVLLWVFGVIIESIVSGTGLVRIDLWALDRVLYFTSPPVTAFMNAAGRLGAGVMIVGSPVAVVVLLLLKRFGYLLNFAFAVAGGAGLARVLHTALYDLRAFPETPLAGAAGLPADSPMMATVFYGLVGYYIIRNINSYRLRVFTAASVLFVVFLVGLSAMYLRTRYLSGVLAGYAGGLFWLSVCATGLEVYLKKAGK